MLSRRIDRVAAPAAFVVAVGLAAGLIALQPVTSPWWITADADAVYTASGLSLLVGNHTKYLDHPGLPEQEALEGVFGAQYLVQRATGSRTGNAQAFATDTLLHLDRARPAYRALAIAFYLLGVALTFVLLARLLGHWSWGFAGSLLWLAAPGLLEIAIQIRPDALLCALVVASGYLVAQAAERRDPWLFSLAAIVIGFAVTVKLPAAALALPLLIAVVWRHPAYDWPERLAANARGALRRQRTWLAPLSGVLLAIAIAFNLNRPAFVFTGEQRTLVLTLLAMVGGYGVCALVVRRSKLVGARLFDPFYAVVAIGAVLGLALPIAFDPEDGFQMLVSIRDSLVGRGVNQGIAPFSRITDSFTTFPLEQGAIVFVVAMVAVAVGLWRRAPIPIIFGSASALLEIMALARAQEAYYYAPGYVAAIPAALWLFRGSTKPAVPLFVWPLIAIVVLPQLQHVRAGTRLYRSEEQPAAALQRTVAPLLRPGVVILTPIAVPDTRFEFGQYGSVQPDYPFRFAPPEPRFIQMIESRGLKIRYYAGPAALDVNGVADVDLNGLGTFRVRRLTRFDDPQDGIGVLEILKAPAGL